MKQLFLRFAFVAPLLLLSCSKNPEPTDPITSAVGLYKLEFNAASNGWKLRLNDGGTGSLVHMTEWEKGTSVGSFQNCDSFSYIVSGDIIKFSNCTIAFDYNRTHNLGESDHVVVTLKEGHINWGYTQGTKKHYSLISIKADVYVNGSSFPNSTWSLPYAYLCDANGQIYQ